MKELLQENYCPLCCKFQHHDRWSRKYNNDKQDVFSGDQLFFWEREKKEDVLMRNKGREVIEKLLKSYWCLFGCLWGKKRLVLGLHAGR